MAKVQLKKMTKEELHDLHFDTMMDVAYMTRGIKFHKQEIEKQIIELHSQTNLLDAVDAEIESRESTPKVVKSTDTTVN